MIFNTCRLTIGKTVIEGLRTVFDIQRTTGSYSRAVISVYNMSLETYNALEYNAVSTLEILSPEGYQVIFTGNFRLQQRRNEEGSSISDLNFFESILLYQEKINLSLDAGSTGKQVLQYFKDAMPQIEFIVNSDAQSKINSLVFKGGYSSPVSDYYTLLTAFIVENLGDDYSPYFGRGKVVIGETTKSKTDININTGMIGAPEYTKRLVKEKGQSEFSGRVKHILIPNLSILDKIYITSQYFRVVNAQLFSSGEPLTQKQYESAKQTGDGLYIVKRIRNIGDTHNGVFTSEIDFVGANQ